MNQDPKFQQRWDFRRRDDDLDSSSDNSKSSSGDEPVLKKHKLVANLILPENDEISNDTQFQPKCEFETNQEIPPKSEKAKRVTKKISADKKKKMVKKKKDASTDVKKKNNKCIPRKKPVVLDDFKKFMESILEELRVARESMITSLRDEMKKMAEARIASRAKRKEARQKNLRAQHQNAESLERTPVRSRTTDSSNHCQALDGRVGFDQAIRTNASIEKEKEEKTALSVKNPNHSSSETPNHIVSSSYLTLPSVLSNLPVQNHRLDSLYFQPGNISSVNFERPNLVTGLSTNRDSSSIVQQEEQCSGLAQLGTKNVANFDQNRPQTSCMQTVFPAPHHQAMDNNILGLRYSGGGYALTQNLNANNYSSYMNYKTDGV